MYEIYTIELGDTLDSIADKVGTTIEKLEEINKTININPGNGIIVPADNENVFGIYTVKKGDNPYSIAQMYSISVDDLMMLNGLEKNDYIYPGQQIIVPNSEIELYITKQGDTFDKIGDDFQTSIDSIMNQNSKIYLLPDQLIVYRRAN